jgi:hypothetical protein
VYSDSLHCYSLELEFLLLFRCIIWEREVYVTVASVKIWDDKYGIQQSKLNVQLSNTRRPMLRLVAAADAIIWVFPLVQKNLAVLVIISYITNVDVVKYLKKGNLDFCYIEDLLQAPVLSALCSFIHSFIHCIKFRQSITRPKRPVGCRISHNTIYRTSIHTNLTHKWPS